MTRLWFGALALGVTILCVVAGTAQPPGKDRGPGDKKGPPPFEPGRVLPPHIRDGLNLSDDQVKKLDALEAEVKERLLKILDADQKQKLQELSRRRPFGPKKDDFDGPRKGRPKDGPQDRPKKDEPPGQVRGGIQWVPTLDGGLREAARTGRPILLVSAAPHCAGVSGVW